MVLTVLPCSEPVTFEATRLAFDALLRDSWPEFADGLADIAADPRIGDTGDNLDRQFYKPDAAAPQQRRQRRDGVRRRAGPRRAAVAVRRAARCACGTAAGEWGDWRPYAAATTLELADGEGASSVEAEYRLDGGAPVSVADDIFVDTVRPTPLALRDVVARRGATVRLPFRVDDAQPCGPTCTAVVSVTTRGGRVLRTFVRRLLPVGPARRPSRSAASAGARTGTSSRRATRPATRRASRGARA